MSQLHWLIERLCPVMVPDAAVLVLMARLGSQEAPLVMPGLEPDAVGHWDDPARPMFALERLRYQGFSQIRRKIQRLAGIVACLGTGLVHTRDPAT